MSRVVLFKSDFTVVYSYGYNSDLLKMYFWKDIYCLLWPVLYTNIFNIM